MTCDSLQSFRLVNKTERFARLELPSSALLRHEVRSSFSNEVKELAGLHQETLDEAWQ